MNDTVIDETCIVNKKKPEISGFLTNQSFVKMTNFKINSLSVRSIDGTALYLARDAFMFSSPNPWFFLSAFDVCGNLPVGFGALFAMRQKSASSLHRIVILIFLSLSDALSQASIALSRLFPKMMQMSIGSTASLSGICIFVVTSMPLLLAIAILVCKIASSAVFPVSGISPSERSAPFRLRIYSPAQCHCYLCTIAGRLYNC